MQRETTILTILLAVSLAGCVLPGRSKKVQAAPPKPAVISAAKAPAPPPPLSIPQTRAQLPAPQPIPEDALATSLPPVEEPRPAVVAPPKPTPKSKPIPAAPPKVEAPPAPAPETGRQPVQEVLRPEERARLLQEAKAARNEITLILSRVPMRVQRQQKDRVDRIKTFMQQSEELERSGDMRQANELALRALPLARELR